MKLERVWRAVWCEPWALRREVHIQLAEIVKQHITGQAHRAEGIAIAEPQKREEKSYQVINDVAIVPIVGVLGQRIGMMDKISGATDILDVREMMIRADNDPAVKAIVFDVDSPGGSIYGVPDLASEIAGLNKPTIAYTAGEMASAAYWLSAGARAIYAGQGAAVGSIGVYLAILDETRRYEREGVSVELIKSGTLKAAGFPGTALTDDQRSQFQASVDYLFQMFSGFVKTQRPAISDDVFKGQVLFGKQGMAVGLVDSIASFEDAIRDARDMAG